MKFWIARDRGGGLEIHSGLPKKRNNRIWWDTSSGEGFHVSPDHPWGDGLTWEDEPKELNLVEEEQVKFWREEAEKYKRALELAFKNVDCSRRLQLGLCGKNMCHDDMCAILNSKHYEQAKDRFFNLYLTQAEQEIKTNQS
jgi:hypothetical protein